MDKNTLIAIVAIFLLVMVFQFVFLRQRPKEGVGEQVQELVEEEEVPQEEVSRGEVEDSVSFREQGEELAQPAEDAVAAVPALVAVSAVVA